MGGPARGPKTSREKVPPNHRGTQTSPSRPLRDREWPQSAERQTPVVEQIRGDPVLPEGQHPVPQAREMSSLERGLLAEIFHLAPDFCRLRRTLGAGKKGFQRANFSVSAHINISISESL